MAASSVLAGLPGSRIESSFSYYGMHDNPASSFSEVKIFIKNTIKEKAIQSKHPLVKYNCAYTNRSKKERD
jgi:hypothetical protein